MKLHKISHLDHDLTARQLAHILFLFAGRDSFFVETIELPEELGTVPCGLYGPIMGDDAICDDRIAMVPRGTRAWQSRVLPMLATARQVRTLTVVAGPHEETCEVECERCAGNGTLSHACILYTAYGGPAAPQEPGDLRAQIAKLEAARAEGDLTAGQTEEIDLELGRLRGKLEESDRFWRDHALSQ